MLGLLLAKLLGLLEDHLLRQARQHLGLVLTCKSCHLLCGREVQNEVIDKVEYDKHEQGEAHEEGPHNHHLHQKRVPHAAVLDQEKRDCQRLSDQGQAEAQEEYVVALQAFAVVFAQGRETGVE